VVQGGDRPPASARRQRDPQGLQCRAAQGEIFDVSGAGDTSISLYTLGIAAGATPEEAAELANHAAGVVVGKLGTATCSRTELERSFEEHGQA